MTGSIHISPAQWLAIGVFAALALLATRGLPRLWRNESDQWNRMPEWWVRGLPTAVVAGWAMLVGTPLTVLAVGRTDTVGDVLTGALGVVLVCIVLAGALWVTVVLFNRPRFVVPPHLRDRPGLLGAEERAATVGAPIEGGDD
jgi:hypothetical protein